MIRSKTLRCIGVGGLRMVVKRRDQRHFEAGHQLGDIATGLPAENPVFVLKRYDVGISIIQEFGRLPIIVELFVVNLHTHGLRIVVAATGISHRNDRVLRSGLAAATAR